MFFTRVEFEGGRAAVKLARVGFTRLQMFSLGRVAERTIEARVARGIGSDDAPMPPLTSTTRRRLASGEVREYSGSGYRQRKVRRGGSPLRDLRLSGQMLADYGVKYADEQKVRIDLSTVRGRDKAMRNERLAPWAGLSRADQSVVVSQAMRFFRSNVGRMARVGGDPTGSDGAAFDDPRDTMAERRSL